MRSRKLQALDFIKRYFAQWGHSPTLGELAAELGVSTKRAYDLVHQLADERQIEVTAGKTRGIRLIDRAEELSEADVLLRLSRSAGRSARAAADPAAAAVRPTPRSARRSCRG
jgi:SOS-response transcriptional repressor LexA